MSSFVKFGQTIQKIKLFEGTGYFFQKTFDLIILNQKRKTKLDLHFNKII